MTVRVLQGHVLDVLAGLPAKSVHVAVTSPPYWNLRNYSTEPQVWGAAEGCQCEWGDPLTDKKRGQDAGDTARVGNTKARVCPPETQQGAFCLKCGAWRGELGSEPTLDLFVRHLVEVFEGVRRVLRDDGTLWVNLGDSYVSNPTTTEIPRAEQGNGTGVFKVPGQHNIDARWQQRPNKATALKQQMGLKMGDLCMAPARFALAMQANGWTLRSEITLCKTAPMPESVQGARWERCRVKVAKNKAVDPLGRGGHQQMLENPERHAGVNPDWLAEWADCPGCPKCAATEGYVQRWGSGRPTSAKESLFIFAKAGARYFYDVEAIRVPTADIGYKTKQSTGLEPLRGSHGTSGHDGNGMRMQAVYNNPAGRNAWNWMLWKPEPLAHAHYAAYPRWLPRLAIQAGTSERGCCPGCGAPWLRVMARGTMPAPRKQGAGTYEGMNRENDRWPSGTPVNSGLQRDEWNTGTTLGWRQSCRCPAHEPAPCTVLDPFSGSGTTVIEANALGRHGVGVELQEKYVAIAHKRLGGQPLSLFAQEAAG